MCLLHPNGGYSDLIAFTKCDSHLHLSHADFHLYAYTDTYTHSLSPVNMDPFMAKLGIAKCYFENAKARQSKPSSTMQSAKAKAKMFSSALSTKIPSRKWHREISGRRHINACCISTRSEEHEYGRVRHSGF